MTSAFDDENKHSLVVVVVVVVWDHQLVEIKMVNNLNRKQYIS
jgi:hypothetical protein